MELKGSQRQAPADPSSPPLASGGFRSSWTCDSVTPVSVPVFPWPCCPRASLSSPGGVLILEEHQSNWFGALPNGLISTRQLLQRLSFHRRSPSQVLGEGPQPVLGGGHSPSPSTCPPPSHFGLGDIMPSLPCPELHAHPGSE